MNSLVKYQLSEEKKILQKFLMKVLTLWFAKKPFKFSPKQQKHKYTAHSILVYYDSMSTGIY